MNKETLLKNHVKGIIIFLIFTIFNISTIKYLYEVEALYSIILFGWFICMLIACGIFIELEGKGK